MKKILTLLIAAGSFFTLHAQSREENRRIILGDGRDNGNYGGNNDRDIVLGRGSNDRDRYPGNYGSDRDYQIEQVNREYSNKIYSIRNNPHLNNGEKERMIRQLENDRQRRINEINRSYNGRYADNDRYDRNDRYTGNGNKKGWQIGKGNPHRNDDGYSKNWKNKGKKNKKGGKDWDD